MRIHATLHNVPSLFSFSRIYSLSISSFCLFFSIVNWCWYKILINTYSDSYWYLNIMVVERLSLFALRVQTNNPNLSVKLKVYLKKDTASYSIKVFVVGFCSFDRQSRTFCELFTRHYSFGLLPVPIDATWFIRYAFPINESDRKMTRWLVPVRTQHFSVAELITW